VWISKSTYKSSTDTYNHWPLWCVNYKLPALQHTAPSLHYIRHTVWLFIMAMSSFTKYKVQSPQLRLHCATSLRVTKFGPNADLTRTNSLAKDKTKVKHVSHLLTIHNVQHTTCLCIDINWTQVKCDLKSLTVLLQLLICKDISIHLWQNTITFKRHSPRKCNTSDIQYMVGYLAASLGLCSSTFTHHCNVMQYHELRQS